MTGVSNNIVVGAVADASHGPKYGKPRATEVTTSSGFAGLASLLSPPFTFVSSSVERASRFSDAATLRMRGIVGHSSCWGVELVRP